ncbi:putative sporulation protein YtxC [Bacillus sp. B1-b2]|uniref:putative sporulation protein YtxC n=1 Tax=Bacillus sp. B1-b2 TaxID=2653201 RepID=UPI001261AF1B|nr:putative sporulation protein YtxC [Bacillus sp. B1-b2]KAB7668025.1 putative sporulation protein YtxC [Bacillus sp. B1-b2]
MIEIEFQNEKDARNLMKIMKRHFKYIDQHMIIERKKDEGIFLSLKSEIELSMVKKSLSDFILQIKADDWASDTLQMQYYFMDELEQRCILEVMHSLIDGEREGFIPFTKEIKIKESLENSMDNFLKETSMCFSFDSFVRFRLKEFLEKLDQYIALSIDEYKMEQDYQVFIDALRHTLIDKNAKIQCIHVFIDLEIQFFDADYREITQQELMMLYEKRNFSNKPFYIDPYSLGPLLALAPKIIYIYTEDREQAIVRTITNIFEERVQLMDKDDFFHRVMTQWETK